MKLDTQKCISEFVRYEKVTQMYKPDGKKGGKTSELLEGIESDKKGYIHLTKDDNGNFYDKATKIPSGFKKKSGKKIREIARDFYCKTKKAPKKIDALPYDKWYNQSRKYWLTIEDILKLGIGGKMEVLALHPNSLDGPLTYFKTDVSYRPEKFFKSEKDTFVHSGELEGIFKKYDGPKSESKPLDIECGKNKWDQKKHYSKYPKTKAVGYMGPMILWKDLKKLPKFYYPE